MVLLSLMALGGLALSFPRGTLAGFAAQSQTNIAIYWGQNSAGQASSQQRLATYCANTPVNIIPLAFLNSIKAPTLLNFANSGLGCTTPFPGSPLLRCPDIEADIKTCQAAGKTILLSLGGATYTEGGFASPAEAAAWADQLWAMFGPPPPSSPSLPRPFGDAVLDGFDLDFESAAQNLAPFAARLRAVMDAAAAGGRRFLLAAAPQCPIPDVAMDAVLQTVALDFVSVQFYNNACGAGGASFNFADWDAWARGSRNPGVKILLGVPGSPGAAGSGYVAPERLAEVIAYSRRFASFGGVMVWDMSQVFAGGRGFLDSVAASLGRRDGGEPPAVTVPSWTTVAIPSRTTVTVASLTTVPAPSRATVRVPSWTTVTVRRRR